MIHSDASILCLSSCAHFSPRANLYSSCIALHLLPLPLLAHNLLLIVNTKVLLKVMAMTPTLLLPFVITVNTALHNVFGKVTLSFHGNAIASRNCFANSTLLPCSLSLDLQDFIVWARNQGKLLFNTPSQSLHKVGTVVRLSVLERSKSSRMPHLNSAVRQTLYLKCTGAFRHSPH